MFTSCHSEPSLQGEESMHYYKIFSIDPSRPNVPVRYGRASAKASLGMTEKIRNL